MKKIWMEVNVQEYSTRDTHTQMELKFRIFKIYILFQERVFTDVEE